MGIVTTCLDVCKLAFAGSAYPTHIAVGTGSSTFSSGNTTLLSEFDRRVIDTWDTYSSNQITVMSTWSPTEINGCILREFGIFTAGSLMTNREITIGSYVFDGEAELQVQQTFKFLIE